MLDQKEFNQLTALVKYGPIPASVEKNVVHNCFQVSITNAEYVKASEKILNHELRLKDLTEFKEWAEVQLDADREAFARMDYGKQGRRQVIIDYLLEKGNDEPVTQVTNRGWFQAWSIGPVPLDSTILQVPIAIIEHENGSVSPYTLDQFKFKDWDDLNSGLKEDGDTDGSL